MHAKTFPRSSDDDAWSCDRPVERKRRNASIQLAEVVATATWLTATLGA
jgi:hypothetical protein